MNIMNILLFFLICFLPCSFSAVIDNTKGSEDVSDNLTIKKSVENENIEVVVKKRRIKKFKEILVLGKTLEELRNERERIKNLNKVDSRYVFSYCLKLVENLLGTALRWLEQYRN